MKRKGRNLETVKFGNVEMKIYCRRKTIKRKLKDCRVVFKPGLFCS